MYISVMQPTSNVDILVMFAISLSDFVLLRVHVSSIVSNILYLSYCNVDYCKTNTKICKQQYGVTERALWQVCLKYGLV